jgi:hypothetical protein
MGEYSLASLRHAIWDLLLTWYQPGYPDGNTQDGYGSMMEVGYVGHYTST